MSDLKKKLVNPAQTHESIKENEEEVMTEELYDAQRNSGEDCVEEIVGKPEDVLEVNKKSHKKALIIGGGLVVTAAAAGTAQGIIRAKKAKKVAEVGGEVVQAAQKTGLALKMSRAAGKIAHVTGKHAPLMLSGAGIVGLGVTAYLSYRSRSRVEAIIEDIEERRDNDEEVNRFEVVRGLSGAIALPVITGLASVTAIASSYMIMNNRIAGLATALASTAAENEYFHRKYVAENGEEAYNEFMNTEEQEVTTTDPETNEEKTELKKTRVNSERHRGRWFSNSTMYTSDDHDYNLAFIDSVKQQLELRLFERGYLTLNEVLEGFGFDREREGMALGWSTADSFDINVEVTDWFDEVEGVNKPQIYLRWATPRYIYDEVDLVGRYSVLG